MSTLMRPRPLTSAGFSRRRLEQLNRSLNRHVESGELPGFVALVNHRGREHIAEIGCRDFEGNGPMRRDTIFRLASMTKPITAVGAMILLEECELRLDDLVEKWLPELGNRRVLKSPDGPLDETEPARRGITVRDLLTFRAGYGEVEFLAPGCPLFAAMTKAGLPLATWPVAMTAQEFLKRLGELPLADQPGERWLYHMGCEILGVLISRVAGKSLGEFLRERIFEPLGMKDTGFHVPGSRLARLPPCYGRDYATGEVVVLHGAGDRFFSRPPVFESGGGGLVSTIDDMLAFGTMMLNGGAYGGERILSRPVVELMTTDHLTPGQKAASPFFENFWSSFGWGLGMAVVTARNDIAGVPGRFGWDGAFGTSWWIDPKERLVGVFMTQRRPDNLGMADFLRDFWTSAYQLIDD